MFRAWIETPIPLPLGVAVIRATGAQDQIFNFKSSTWVALPADGMPLPDQWLRGIPFGPAVGVLAGTYRVDLPELCMEGYSALMVLELDGAGAILNRQCTIAIDVLYRTARVTLSR